MKLDNRGWGTTQMIVISIGMLCALLVSIFFIYKLYGSLDKAVGNNNYMNLENELAVAAQKYIGDNGINIIDNYRVTYKTLKKENYISNLTDLNNNECDGYVLISKVDGLNHYKGYVSCNNYQTRNY